MSKIVEKWKAFCEWQRRPSHIPQMTEEHHCCHSCGQEYQGNYCPCCGQSGKIGRYSFKNAMEMFFDDVLGMGNRGMFRTLRDLLLRPGYLIRDYISGMQSAYFPPFKLLFLLTALLLVVESGANLKGENYLASYHEKTVNIDGTSAEKNKKKEISSWSRVYDLYIVKVREFKEDKPAFFWLSLLFVWSLPLYLFFRKSPNIPNLRFSELLIALVYTWGMRDIYDIVFTFFGVSEKFQIVVYFMPIIPLKQLSGFKWWRTSSYVILSFLAALVILFSVIYAAIEIQLYLEAS